MAAVFAERLFGGVLLGRSAHKRVWPKKIGDDHPRDGKTEGRQGISPSLQKGIWDFLDETGRHEVLSLDFS